MRVPARSSPLQRNVEQALRRRGAAVIAGFGLTFALAACRHQHRRQGNRSELRPAAPMDLRLAGRIYGSVDFDGAPPALPALKMSADPFCASHHQGAVANPELEINANHTVRDAFVYVAHGLGGYRFRPPAWAVELKQTGCMFQPHVLGAMAGQKIQISSDDATPHNVHFLGPPGADWNLALPPSAPPQRRRFPRSSASGKPIEVVCNVHPWMRAWIGIRPNPYFSVTGGNGRYRFPPLPPGIYTVAVWQELYGLRQRQVKLSPHSHLRLDFHLGGRPGGGNG